VIALGIAVYAYITISGKCKKAVRDTDIELQVQHPFEHRNVINLAVGHPHTSTSAPPPTYAEEMDYYRGKQPVSLPK
jgi:hypothetical protein